MNTHTVPQKVRVVPESDEDRSCYPHLSFVILPPAPTWTHRRINLPICAYSISAFMYMEPRKAKTWLHGMAQSLQYIHMYPCSCTHARFLSDQSKHGDGKSCRARGRNSIAQTYSANICTLFSSSHVSLNSTPRQKGYSTNPLPSIFLFPWPPPRINRVPACFRVVSIRWLINVAHGTTPLDRHHGERR